MTQTQLMRISVTGDSLSLQGYADTLVYLPASNAGEKATLVAIRLGGDPAVTQALAFSLSGGSEFKAGINGESLVLDGKKMRYKRKMSTADPYAEALLTAEDEEFQEKEKAQGREGIKTVVKRRVCYLYCPKGDHTRLFSELQKKTSVPMLPEFEGYVLAECRDRGFLTQLAVLSTTEDFEAWRLTITRDDENLVSIVDDGLKRGCLHIPGADPGKPNAFKTVSTISQYLDSFGSQIAEKIKSRFAPLYDPATEPPSAEVREIDANICSTYKLLLSDGDIKSVQGDTGHSKSQVLLDVYAHSQEKARMALTKKVERDFYQDSASQRAHAQDNPLMDLLAQVINDDPQMQKLLLETLLTQNAHRAREA